MGGVFIPALKDNLPFRWMPDMFFHDKLNIVNGHTTKVYYILFNLIAIAIIAYLGVDAFYRIVRVRFAQVDIKEKKTEAKVLPEETPAVKSGLNDYQTIIDRNIFSKISVGPAKKGDVDIDELKRTSLKLALIGTIAGDNKTSAAIIEDTGNKTQGLYKIGDNVQNAAIKSILRKKVVLQTGGRDEVLTMEESESAGTGPASNIAQTETVAEAAPSASAASDRNIAMKRSEINESFKDINELLSQASIQPHSTNGDQDGLTVTGIKAGSLFRKMGLRNGDIVKGANNEAIKTTEDLVNMYNDLKSSPDISLQILRRGQDMNINYNISD